MYIKHELGMHGEEIATNYLNKMKYKIIERNFRCYFGEIDIIAKEGEEYVFLEVKTRTNSEYGEPIEAVDDKKLKHLKKCIEYYIYINKLEYEYIRIDVIEVYISDKNYIHHVKNIV